MSELPIEGHPDLIELASTKPWDKFWFHCDVCATTYNWPGMCSPIEAERDRWAQRHIEITGHDIRLETVE